MHILPGPLVAETLALKNSLRGDIDLRVQTLTCSCYEEITRSRLSSIIWVLQGRGRVKYEFNEYAFSAPCLIFFAPYQPFVFSEAENICGVSVHFANDFYCVERHKKMWPAMACCLTTSMTTRLYR